MPAIDPQGSQDADMRYAVVHIPTDVILYAGERLQHAAVALIGDTCAGIGRSDGGAVEEARAAALAIRTARAVFAGNRNAGMMEQ
jgi:hypothetical protein